MTSSFAGFGVLILTLPVMIAQWMGVIGLGKGRRNAAWWCMAAGVACSTLGTIGSAVFLGMMIFGISSGLSTVDAGLMWGSGLVSGTGSLLFAIGFAIHGMRAAKHHDRTAELETIAAAQAEELNRLRSAQGGAN